jgi:hypothetical protein
MEKYIFQEDNSKAFKTRKPIEYIVNEKGCWICISHAQQGSGYPVAFRKNFGTVVIHRYSYMINKGEIPSGMVVMHSCDDRSCINPDHLSLGTYKDNMIDMVKKGRNKHGQGLWCVWPLVGACKQGEAHSNAKLTEDQVREIFYSEDTLKNLSKKYGVTEVSISYIRNGRTWKHLNLTRPT